MLAFAVSAQEDGGKKFVLGGNLGFNLAGQGYEWDGQSDVDGLRSDFDMTIAPKFGYQINDKFLVGATLGLTISNTNNYTSEANLHPTAGTRVAPAANISSDNGEVGATNSDHDVMFNIGLFGRYNLCKFNKFTLFAELQLGLGFGGNQIVNTIEKPQGAELAEQTTNDVSRVAFNATIVPGLNYAFSDSFSMDLYFNLIGLTFNTTTWVDHQAANLGTAANPNYIEDSYTTTNFGLNCNLRNNTIDNYTAAIAVGFNFHF